MASTTPQKPMRKTLRGNAADLVSHFSTLEPPVFNTSDARKLLGDRRVASILNRLVKQGWITRLRSGVFEVSPIWSRSNDTYMPDRYEAIASWLKSPYYFGFLSALEIHDALDHPVVGQIFVVVPKPRRIPESVRERIRWTVMTPKRFDWGIERSWRSGISLRVSDLERTFLDAVHRPRYAGGITTIFHSLWRKASDLDAPRLLRHAERYRNQTATRRLGWILSRLDSLRFRSICDALLSLTAGRRGTAKVLDPTLPPKGKIDREWGILVNVQADQLRSGLHY